MGQLLGETISVCLERRRRGHWVHLTRIRANAHGIFVLRRSGLDGELLRARAGGSLSRPFKAVRTRDRTVRPFGDGRRSPEAIVSR